MYATFATMRSPSRTSRWPCVQTRWVDLDDCWNDTMAFEPLNHEHGVCLGYSEWSWYWCLSLVSLWWGCNGAAFWRCWWTCSTKTKRTLVCFPSSMRSHRHQRSRPTMTSSRPSWQKFVSTFVTSISSSRCSGNPLRQTPCFSHSMYVPVFILVMLVLFGILISPCLNSIQFMLWCCLFRTLVLVGCGEHFQPYCGHPWGDCEATGPDRGHGGDDRRGEPTSSGGQLLWRPRRGKGTVDPFFPPLALLQQITPHWSRWPVKYVFLCYWPQAIGNQCLYWKGIEAKDKYESKNELKSSSKYKNTHCLLKIM